MMGTGAILATDVLAVSASVVDEDVFMTQQNIKAVDERLGLCPTVRGKGIEC